MLLSVQSKLWKRVDLYMKFLRIVPFVRMIAVCNTLSFGIADENSDIDLFIVTRKGRMFFVRFFVTVILQLLGVRRYADKVSGRFCLSFFVDDSADDLSNLAYANDYYLAFWFSRLVPVIDYDYFDTLRLKNSWVKLFFADTEFVRFKKVYNSSDLKIARFLRQSFEFLFKGSIGNFIEINLGRWQIARARSKKKKLADSSGIIINDHVLKFHNYDLRKTFTNGGDFLDADGFIIPEKFLTYFAGRFRL